MAAKSFASSADLGVKEQTLEVLADGVYALTAEGDPNLGAIEGEDFLVCFEALATPVAARGWLAKLREHTDKPMHYLLLSHVSAVPRRPRRGGGGHLRGLEDRDVGHLVGHVGLGRPEGGGPLLRVLDPLFGVEEGA